MREQALVEYYNKFSFLDEGPETATRGGVNGSQLKFSSRTWPISQN
jgi:hypothetical protein